MNRDRAFWRAMTPDDIADVVAIAAVVHQKFYEEPAVFLERLQLFPCGAWCLERERSVIGYALSHPWCEGELPSLNSLLGKVPEVATTYYIHDLALLPAARGTRAAGELVSSLTSLARSRDCLSMTLIAVNGSRSFWEKQGFCVADHPEMSAKLYSYEESAVMMVKTLA